MVDIAHYIPQLVSQWLILVVTFLRCYVRTGRCPSGLFALSAFYLKIVLMLGERYGAPLSEMPQKKLGAPLPQC